MINLTLLIKVIGLITVIDLFQNKIVSAKLPKNKKSYYYIVILIVAYISFPTSSTSSSSCSAGSTSLTRSCKARLSSIFN